LSGSFSGVWTPFSASRAQRFRLLSARLRFSRIMLTLSFAAALMAFISMPRDFYLMRFSLGSGEEGFVS